MNHVKSIPFKIDKNNKTKLSIQLTDGFRRAILTGYYRDGERLPSFSDMATELGVSIRAPREAMKLLAEENLVRTRPRTGCEVVARGKRIWKGRVICTFVSALEGSYYFSRMIGALRRRMIAGGYSLITVAVDAGKDGAFDYSQLDSLSAEKTDFIVAVHPPEKLAEHIAGYQIPALAFVDVREVPGIEMLRRTAVCAVRSVVNAVVKAGIKRVMLVNYAGGAEERELLERRGVEVESVSVEAVGPNFLEMLRRNSMETVFERFAPGRPHPELIVFTDDHVAHGGLLGLALRGVASPEDIGIITLSNRGSAPVWPRTLARVEIDPEDDGVKLAETIIAKIERRSVPETGWWSRFVKGETFPCSGR
jgi:DNA-binding transcriptional regulator YhcF (GntR family)